MVHVKSGSHNLRKGKDMREEIKEALYDLEYSGLWQVNANNNGVVTTMPVVQTFTHNINGWTYTGTSVLVLRFWERRKLRKILKKKGLL